MSREPRADEKIEEGRAESECLAPNTPLEKSDAISSLQTTLVDLRVWAYNLSDTSALLLEYLRDLLTYNHRWKTRLQQTNFRRHRLLPDLDR